jgi:flagellar motor switch protein FliG
MDSMVTIEPPMRRMTGASKVAVLLLAMDRSMASKLLKHFDSTELRDITRSAAELGSFPIADVDLLVDEFESRFTAGADLIGDAGGAEQLLNAALPPDQVSDIMSDVLGGSRKSVWERLATVPENAFATFLGRENPQVGAMILNRVDTACAARILAKLESGQRHEIARRMLTIRTVDNSMVRFLEEILLEDLLTNAEDTGTKAHSRMADIINKLDKEQADAILANIGETRPQSAETLRSMLFAFEDVVRLPQRARLLLFEKVSGDHLVTALRGASPLIAEAVLSSLGARARRMVEQELASDASVNPKDIAKARRQIADMVLSMNERGEINLAELTP